MKVKVNVSQIVRVGLQKYEKVTAGNKPVRAAAVASMVEAQTRYPDMQLSLRRPYPQC